MTSLWRSRVAGPVIALVALAGGSAAVLVASDSSSAGAVTVSNETDLRSAFATGTSIVLSADVILSDCSGRVLRFPTNGALILDGAGHTITQTCGNLGVLGVNSSSSDALTLKNVTIANGHPSNDGFSN